MEAKNAPSGSYAAGCPLKGFYDIIDYPDCRQCEIVK